MKHDQEAAQKAMRATLTTHMGAWTFVETPFGSFHVAALDGAIVQTSLPGTSRERFLADLEHRHPSANFRADDKDPLLQRACTQLIEYASGERQAFDVPIQLNGTEFQRRVWNALAAIPFGEVRSYQEVAQAIGRPGASRAVGQANHNNPVAPIIPCHRVITSTGLLGGYGGGMPLKRALLQHEGVQLE